jgi:hypothetical protein
MRRKGQVGEAADIQYMKQLGFDLALDAGM